MKDNNGLLKMVRPGLADALGRTIITPENRAELFLQAYDQLCQTHKCQFIPTFIIQGSRVESRLQVEMRDGTENSN